MAGEAPPAERNLLRGLTLPVALVVAVVVLIAWATSDDLMGFLMMPSTLDTSFGVLLAFVLLVVMMVAMMLPSALPMVLTYRGITRLEAGRAVRPPDSIGTAVFASAYFLLWGAFGLLALLGLLAYDFVDPMGSSGIAGFGLGFVPAGVLLSAGAYQVTRTKDTCLRSCQSPMGFLLTRWQGGHLGAWRMGLRHALYCIGCCWLIMLVLFVSGAMSLVWMGGISVAIFVEKIGWRPALVSRTIGALLVVAGIVFAVQAALIR